MLLDKPLPDNWDAKRIHKELKEGGNEWLDYLNKRQLINGEFASLKLFNQTVKELRAVKAASGTNRRRFLQAAAIGTAVLGAKLITDRLTPQTQANPIDRISVKSSPTVTVKNRETPSNTQKPPIKPEKAVVSEKLNFFDEFIRPFIEEAMIKRAEREKLNPQEYSHRIDKELNQNRINILLLGFGEEHGENYQDFSGPITILSYDLITKKIVSVSFSRDMRAPELEDKTPREKLMAVPIRHAFRNGGFEMTRKVAEDATGLAVDFQVVFKDTVIHDFIRDVAGNTLEIDVPKEQETNDFRFNGKEYPKAHFDKGNQTMDAMRAMYFILGEHQRAQSPEDERTFRKNLVLKVLLKKIVSQVKRNPLGFANIGWFLLKKINEKSVYLDMNQNLLVNGLNGVANTAAGYFLNPATKEVIFPELDDSVQININDAMFGGEGVKRVHNINESDHPAMKEDYRNGVMKEWMLVPPGANPYGDFVDDYWQPVRGVIKRKLSGDSIPNPTQISTEPPEAVKPFSECVLYPDELPYNEVEKWIGSLRNHEAVLTESIFTKELAAMPEDKREEILEVIASAHAKALIDHYKDTNVIIGLDPGHGGSDNGSSAITKEGVMLLEKDLTWQVANMTTEMIYQQTKGKYTVIMLRPKEPHDEDLDKDGFISPVERIQKRKALLLDMESKLSPSKEQEVVFLSIHFNGSPDPSQVGSETYWPNSAAVTSPKLRQASQSLTQILHHEIIRSIRQAGYPIADRGAKEDPDKRQPAGNSDTTVGPYVVLGSPKLDRRLRSL